jgi:glyoxylase-like metal-dependent hydrolase (beta-lactamase superfamily II)
MPDFPVIALLDGSMTFMPTTIFPTSTAQEWTRHQRLLSGDGALVMPFGGYLVRGTNDRLVLIDAGGGPEYTVPADRGRVTQRGRLPQSLRAAGHDPEEVSDVVFTHLHLDHVGWASRHGRPFFPNATYWCHQHDWDHFLPATGPAPQLPVPPLLEPVRDQLRTWTGSTTTLAGLELWHTPGHTPGSSIVMVPRGRGQLAIIGDLVHTPAEFAESWSGLADADPERALQMRRQVGARLAALGADVCGAHFPEQRAGRLRHNSDQLSWDPDGAR